MSIIIERTKDDSKESETFREQLKSRSDEFAEQMLEQHFGALIGYAWSLIFNRWGTLNISFQRWLKDAERKLDAGDIEGLRQEERRVSNIIQAFSADWKKSLDQINGLAHCTVVCGLSKLSSGEIMTSFPNLKLGTGILQQSLTLLVQYYHRWDCWILDWKVTNIPSGNFGGHRDCADSVACSAWLHSLRSLRPLSWSTSTSSWWRWRSTSQASNSSQYTLHCSFCKQC